MLLLAVPAGLIARQDPLPPKPVSDAHIHIGHVMTRWIDTPGTRGLLATLSSEADVAAAHARLAAQSPADLAAMQRHAAHVLHALDPSLEPAGPGAGYGVRKAAAGSRQHVQLAAKMTGASKALATHAHHVATSMGNVLEWTEAAIVCVQRIRAATSASAAAPIVPELVAWTTAIVDGLDADRDGTIVWQAGEGGIAQATAHMGLLMKAEGLM